MLYVNVYIGETMNPNISSSANSTAPDGPSSDSNSVLSMYLRTIPKDDITIAEMIAEAIQKHGKYWMRFFQWSLIRGICLEKRLKLEATKKYQEKVTRMILWKTSIPVTPVTSGRKFIHFWQTVARQGKRKWMNGRAS